METKNGRISSASSMSRSSSFFARLGGIFVLLLFLTTSCTKGDETQCGDPNNSCDEIITEEIVDF